LTTNWTWRISEGQSAFFESDVEVWLAGMDQATESIEVLAKTLSAAERVRADRFTLKRDADGFVFRQATLRALLGFYLHEEPGGVKLHLSPGGNSSLPPDSPIRFNMSYAGDMVVLGISRRYRIGVDIERVRPLDQASIIMDSFFTYEERRALRKMSSHLQMEAFYRCWSRKEALLKATGDSLSRALDSVNTLPMLDESHRAVVDVGGENGKTKWTVLTLPPISGYTAAVATEGNSVAISTWLAN
jgi:4'-phosphopantetheinyl transferase